MDQLCVTEKRKEKRLNKDYRVHRKKRSDNCNLHRQLPKA